MPAQRLRHMVYENDSRLYFYDGELEVIEGVVAIPDGQDNWAGAAWVQGFQRDADTGEHLDWATVTARAVAESDEEQDADEGADGGRQPIEEDGVRPSAGPRLEVVSRSGVRMRGGDGTADGESAD